ncbi:hypothetical protein FOCC_FOCC009503, partial [Frankliniella occidentalis]
MHRLQVEPAALLQHQHLHQHRQDAVGLQGRGGHRRPRRPTPAPDAGGARGQPHRHHFLHGQALPCHQVRGRRQRRVLRRHGAAAAAAAAAGGGARAAAVLREGGRQGGRLRRQQRRARGGARGGARQGRSGQEDAAPGLGAPRRARRLRRLLPGGRARRQVLLHHHVRV